jgi:hypothetical protein
MLITPEQRARLDRLMNLRRLDLGLTWREVAARSGRSYEALRQLRTGPGGINELTAVQFSRALEWEPHSLLDIIEGGEPVTAARQEPGRSNEHDLKPECEYEKKIMESAAAPDQKRLIIMGHRKDGHNPWCRPAGTEPSSLASAAGLSG